MGLNYAHNAGFGSVTGGTLSTPANENVQVISLRIRLGANSKPGTEYNITLPQSDINGVGGYTSVENSYIPDIFVRLS